MTKKLPPLGDVTRAVHELEKFARSLKRDNPEGCNKYLPGIRASINRLKWLADEAPQR
jgi:hypothetical protein